MNRSRVSRRDAPGRARTGRRRSWIPYAGVALAAVLLYLGAVRYGFIGFDDTLLVVDNREFLSHPSNAPQAFLQDAFHIPGYKSSGAYYRPVLTLSLMLDAAIGGVRPAVYHADNVLEHALAACLLLALLTGLGYPALASFLAALLYAVHPLFAGVVAWVPGRIESLLTIFVLAAMVSLLSWLRRGGAWRYVLHLFCLALALFTKEIAVFLVPALAFYLLAVHRERPASRRSRALLLGWLALVLLWVTMRSIAVKSPLGAGAFLHQLAGNLPVLIHYLGKAVIPVHLSVAPTIADTPILPGLFALALISAAVLLSRRKRPGLVLFGVLWFVLFAVPPLIVPRMVGLEQRMYLPAVGLTILLVETISGLLPPVLPPLPRRALRVGALALVLLFAVLAWNRAAVYRGRQEFWESAVRSSPHSSYARASLGAFYLSRGRSEEAKAQYLRALEINPVEPKANGNLGVIAAQEGRLEEARAYFRREIEVDPDYADAWFNLGISYAQAGDLQHAAEMWDRTLKVSPDHRGALRQLAGYYRGLGMPDRAAEYERRLSGR